MKISSIIAINFKSFNETTGIKYTPSEGLNIIVGENNNGKSNLLQIYNTFIDYFNGTTKYINETHRRNNLEIKLELELKLDENDVLDVLTKLNIETFSDKLGDYFKSFVLILNSKESHIRFKINDLNAFFSRDNWYLSRYNTINSTSRQELSWDEFKDKLHSNSFLELIEKYDQVSSNNDISKEEIFLIKFPELNDILKELMIKRIIVFPEFRSRPQDNLRDIEISTGGQELSSLLYGLKNGGVIKEKIYEKIKENFTLIFPTLSFAVKKEMPYLYFFYKDDATYEIPHNSIGAGIIETLILVTHLTRFKGELFIIDEPELHLHPHAVRNLAKVISDSSKSNQVICITHSPRFINLKQIKTISVVKKEQFTTCLKSITVDSLTKDELRLFRSLEFEDNYKEIFFSRFVVLVEGDTEAGALSGFAEKINKNFDTSGISVIGVGGCNFKEYIKILCILEIPYLIMCDHDVIKNINPQLINSKFGQIKTSSLFRQLIAIDSLSDDDIKTIQNHQTSLISNTHIKCNKNSCIKESIKQECYNADALLILSKISKEYNFFVLGSDFEGTIKRDDSAILVNANKKYSGSKRLKGLYISENITRIPREFQHFIRLIYKNMDLQ